MNNPVMRFFTALATITGIVALNWLAAREFEGLTVAIFLIVSIFFIISVGAMAMNSSPTDRRSND